MTWRSVGLPEAIQIDLKRRANTPQLGTGAAQNSVRLTETNSILGIPNKDFWDVAHPHILRPDLTLKGFSLDGMRQFFCESAPTPK